jgi:hypothetical protein
VALLLLLLQLQLMKLELPFLLLPGCRSDSYRGLADLGT